MNCDKCKYCKYIKVYQTTMCVISHKIQPSYCDLISEAEVENMDICYNCEYWIGGGDWGLSCKKDYYNCSANGFDKACKFFNKK